MLPLYLLFASGAGLSRSLPLIADWRGNEAPYYDSRHISSTRSEEPRTSQRFPIEKETAPHLSVLQTKERSFLGFLIPAFSWLLPSGASHEQPGAIDGVAIGNSAVGNLLGNLGSLTQLPPLQPSLMLTSPIDPTGAPQPTIPQLSKIPDIIDPEIPDIIDPEIPDIIDPEIPDIIDQNTCSETTTRRRRFLNKTPLMPLFGAANIANRIIGGTDAESGAWPWQVSLRFWGWHRCGGSLVAPDAVVTAAHCVAHDPSPRRYAVAVGSSSLYAYDEELFSVVSISIHPSFGQPMKRANDVAVLKLATPTVLTHDVRPICLAEKDFVAGTECVVTGWGRMLNDERTDELQQVVVPLIEQHGCNDARHWNGKIDASMVCAGFERGDRGSCRGDSGGPLVCRRESGRWELQGVVSWSSAGCGRWRPPSVYGRVPTFRDWIISQL